MIPSFHKYRVSFDLFLRAKRSKRVISSQRNFNMSKATKSMELIPSQKVNSILETKICLPPFESDISLLRSKNPAIGPHPKPF
jgi:hypothetical protein